MACILIVDDDSDIQGLVGFNLKQAGFETLCARNGREALDQAHTCRPDLIILDLMLPDLDGLEICRRLRQDEGTRRIPVLMLTARAEEIDRVLGFELGADDYVTKPFSPRELVLRVRSILRRGKEAHPDAIRFGSLEILAGRRQCLVDGQSVLLTAKEFDLLYELAHAHGNVITRDILMERVWGYHGEATSRTLDTHVKRLREKLGSAASMLETVRGIGFRMSPPDSGGEG